jgi:hypothetical protein
MKYSQILFIVLLAPVADFQAADAPATKPMIGTIPVAKMLFLRNSITLHGPASAIGWTGNWGMAASDQEKDYVHLLTAEIARNAGARPEIQVRNIADFERGHDGFEIEAIYKKELEFEADLAKLGRDEANVARSERKIEHAGVAAHPGDKGMRAIADALDSAILKTSKQGD